MACPVCNDTAMVTFLGPVYADCGECGGTGHAGRIVCLECKGAGAVATTGWAVDACPRCAAEARAHDEARVPVKNVTLDRDTYCTPVGTP